MPIPPAALPITSAAHYNRIYSINNCDMDELNAVADGNIV